LLQSAADDQPHAAIIGNQCVDPARRQRQGIARSAVTPWLHQVRTYTRFLCEWPSRILIADEVGIGKTISAGLILRQAILSGLAKRVLILTPKSVQIQWQNELYEKFNLNVPIYDGAALSWRVVHGAAEAEKPVARDAWQAEPVVLVSSFLMRRADRQRELLEDIPGIGNWVPDRSGRSAPRAAARRRQYARKGPERAARPDAEVEGEVSIPAVADRYADAGTSGGNLGFDGSARDAGGVATRRRRVSAVFSTGIGQSGS
jgi:hypothetical protein